MRCLYFIVTPQQLWSSPRLGAIFSHQNFPPKSPARCVSPNIWQIFVFEGGNSCLRHFRGAAKTANLLRGLSLMRKSCARSFATTKPRKSRDEKAPEGAAARGERRSLKKKRTSAGRGRQRLDKAAGSETQGRAYERRGLVDQRGLKGRSGALGTSVRG